MSKSTGGCLCGDIRYQIEGQPFRVANCHCNDCKKATGAAFSTNVFFKQDQLELTKGSPSLYRHMADSGNGMTKQFCAACGSQLFALGDLRPGIVSVKVGSLDDAAFVQPTLNVYTSSALHYIAIDPGLDNHAEMPGT